MVVLIIKFIFQTNDLRLILDWGENPKDLENELVAFDQNGGEICRITYSNKGGKPVACGGHNLYLDVDSTSVNKHEIPKTCSFYNPPIFIFAD